MKYKSFSLIELLIVIIIVSSIYGIFLFNIQTKSKTIKEKPSLLNLKTFLYKNFVFTNTLKFTCINEGNTCYVLSDETLLKDVSFKDFFKNKPEVYKYDKSLDLLEFKRIKLNKEHMYSVYFEFNINKDRKSDDMIIYNDNKVYIYNSLYDKPIILENLNDISDFFDEKIQELKNAF